MKENKEKLVSSSLEVNDFSKIKTTKMADPSCEASSSSSSSNSSTIMEQQQQQQPQPSQVVQQAHDIIDKNDDFIEPDKKRRKLIKTDGKSDQKLEHRLGGILCCAVCLDLPRAAVYQVIN